MRCAWIVLPALLALACLPPAGPSPGDASQTSDAASTDAFGHCLDNDGGNNGAPFYMPDGGDWDSGCVSYCTSAMTLQTCSASGDPVPTPCPQGTRCCYAECVPR